MRRKVISRLGAVFVGMLCALILFELGHRAFGAAYRVFGGRSGANSRGTPVVLCVGDSHTFGTSVPREETYPAALQAELDRLAPEAGFEVVNRGIPGMNTSQLADLLPVWLAEYDPVMVVVWIGRNDHWNLEDPAGLTDQRESTWPDRLLAASRLVTVLRAYAVARDDDAVPDEATLRRSVRDQSWKWIQAPRLDAVAYESRVGAGLNRIASRLDADERSYLLLSYPQSAREGERAPWLGFARLHRRVVAEVAAAHHVVWVDTALDFERARLGNPSAEILCQPPFPDLDACLFVNAMGAHPAPPLYRAIGHSVALATVDVLELP
jgi:hypothetical protein